MHPSDRQVPAHGLRPRTRGAEHPHASCAASRRGARERHPPRSLCRPARLRRRDLFRRLRVSALSAVRRGDGSGCRPPGPGRLRLAAGAADLPRLLGRAHGDPGCDRRVERARAGGRVVPVPPHADLWRVRRRAPAGLDALRRGLFLRVRPRLCRGAGAQVLRLDARAGRRPRLAVRGQPRLEIRPHALGPRARRELAAHVPGPVRAGHGTRGAQRATCRRRTDLAPPAARETRVGPGVAAGGRRLPREHPHRASGSLHGRVVRAGERPPGTREARALFADRPRGRAPRRARRGRRRPPRAGLSSAALSRHGVLRPLSVALRGPRHTAARRAVVRAPLRVVHARGPRAHHMSGRAQLSARGSAGAASQPFGPRGTAGYADAREPRGSSTAASMRSAMRSAV